MRDEDTISKYEKMRFNGQTSRDPKEAKEIGSGMGGWRQSDDTQTVPSIIRKQIQDNPCIVFGEAQDPNLREIQELFKDQGLGYAFIDLATIDDAPQWRKEFSRMLDSWSVDYPLMFIHGKPTQGASKIKELANRDGGSVIRGLIGVDGLNE